MTEPKPPNVSIDYNNIASTTASVVYANTDQEVIVVTRDKLHLCLQGVTERMVLRDRWMIPLGVLVPLALAVTTTSFTTKFKIGGGEWETIYIMLILFTVAWLVICLRQRRRSVTVGSIVDELAKNPVSISSTKATQPGPDRSIDLIDNEQLWPGLVSRLEVGDRVIHQSFGFGLVQEVGTSGGDADARINFGKGIGLKHLVLRLAPLKKL